MLALGLGLGLATLLGTLAAGPLYAALGPGAFWVMAGACAAAWVAPASSKTTATQRVRALTRSFYRATGRTREQYGDADEDG